MKKDLSNNFQLPTKPSVVKTSTPDDIPKKVSINENTTRVSIDLPEDLYTQIRLHIVKSKQTIKEFMIEAAKKALS